MKKLVLLAMGLALMSWGVAYGQFAMYEADDYPSVPGGAGIVWTVATGDDAYGEVVEIEPGNNAYHIISVDGGPGGAETGNLRVFWPWEASLLTDITAECRFRQTAGGMFMTFHIPLELEAAEPTGIVISIETATPGVGAHAGDLHTFWVWNAGGDENGNVNIGVNYEINQKQAAGLDWFEWHVLRSTIEMGDPYPLFKTWLDGELWFEMYTQPTQKTLYPPGTDYAAPASFRWGHSGGSGPGGEEHADIYVDYVWAYIGEAYEPGTVPDEAPDWLKSAVEASSWGAIKSTF